jgi:hypothetical protein
MTDFTEAIASSDEAGGVTITCAEAEAAIADKMIALSAAIRSLNINRSIVLKKSCSKEKNLTLERGAVLELFAVVRVALRRAALAAFIEPSIRHRVRQRDAARIDRPGSAVDSRLIEFPAAASAGKGEARTATRSDRFDSANLPVVRPPRRQSVIPHIASLIFHVFDSS